MSGEALSRNHRWLLALTATDDWVRERQGREPSRAARHCGQAQFHCGKPPPAAAPSTRTHTPILHHSPWPGRPRKDGNKRTTRRRRTIRPGALSAYYSDSGQIPAYAVTSALVPISSNSGVSHFWSSTGVTSLHVDFIVQSHRRRSFRNAG